MMYGEHPNGGKTKTESHDVKFLEKEFSSIGEMRKDVTLYELLSSIGEVHRDVALYES